MKLKIVYGYTSLKWTRQKYQKMFAMERVRYAALRSNATRTQQIGTATAVFAALQYQLNGSICFLESARFRAEHSLRNIGPYRIFPNILVTFLHNKWKSRSSLSNLQALQLLKTRTPSYMLPNTWAPYDRDSHTCDSSRGITSGDDN